MDSLVVRAASDEDVEEASAVLRAAYDQFRDSMHGRFDIYIADVVDVRSRWETSELLLAVDGDAIAGCINFYPDASLAEYPGDAIPFPGDWAAIRLLAVHPEHRGKRVGRVLTEHSIQLATQRGCKKMGLHTTEAMSVARAMYERMGFHRLPEYDFYPTPRLAVLAYGLDLAGPPAGATS